MNELIIDPNRSNNPESGYYDVSKLNIDVRLETIRKQGTSIIATGDSTQIIGRVPSSVDFLSGNNVDKNEKINSLTTLFTEANNNFDIVGGDNVYKDLETLGITEINIDFNSSNVPIVQLTMVDIRGRLFQQGNQSPFAVFFELPYPIFKLTVRGFLGKAVTYELHLVKFNSSFNSTYGGFEIKCEFIGYNYAFLSDMLIGYLRGVGYTKIGAELLKESSVDGVHFDDLRQELKDLRETVVNFSTTQEQSKVESLTTVIDSLFDLEFKIRQYFSKEILGNLAIANKKDSFPLGLNTLVTFSPNDVLIEVNKLKEFANSLIKDFNDKYTEHTIKSLAEANDYDMFNLNGRVINSIEDGVLITSSTEIHNRQEELPTITENLVNMLGSGTHICKTVTIEFISAEIQRITKKYQNDLNEQRQLATSVFENFVENSKLNLGIGYYFKVLCNHADVFMKSIAKVAYKAESDLERRSQFTNIENLNYNESEEKLKIMPFPEYRDYEQTKNGSNNDNPLVEKWIGKIQADGKIIPEVEFIEDLLHGMIRAKQDEKDDLALLESPMGEQIISFTPTHPIDVLNVEPSYHPYRNIEKIKNINQLKKYLSYRSAMFLSTQNTMIDLPNSVMSDYAEIEYENLKDIFSKNETIRDLLFNQAGNLQVLINDTEYNSKYGVQGESSDFFTLNKLLYKGAYSNKIDIGESNVIDFENNDSYVLGQNHAYSLLQNSLQVSGFRQNFSEFNALNSTPIKLSVTDEPDNGTIVRYLEVLDQNNESYTKDDIKGAKFNAYKGYPFFKNYNNQSTILSFYKENITPNSLCTYRNNGDKQLLFGSDIYRFQGNVESKAFVFLLSIPFNISDKTITNMNSDLAALFDQRSGVVKSSFLWCAWLGAIFKAMDNNLNLKIWTQGKELLPTHQDNIKVNSGNERYWKFNHDGKVKLPYELSTNKFSMSTGSYINWISISNGYPEIGKFVDHLWLSENYKMFNADIRSQFIAKFDEFVGFFKTDILPYDKVFIDDMDNFEYSITMFDASYGEQIYNSRKKNEYPNLSYTFFNGERKSVKRINNQTITYPQKKLFNNNPNFKFSPNGFESHTKSLGSMALSETTRNTYHVFNATITENSVLYQNIINLMNKYVNVYNYNANFWTYTTDKTNLIDIDFKFLSSDVGTNSLIKTINVTRLNNALIERIKSADSQKRAEDIENIDKESSMMMTVFGSDNSEDIKLKLYKDVKSIYDKWICGNPKFIGSDYKPLYDSFKFNNRTFENIEETFKVNLFTLIKDLYANLHQPLYAHISKVLATNNFNFIPMPNYVDISNRNELMDMFTPRYYSDANDPINPIFMCMYVGEYSSKLDLGDQANFKNDGISMTRVGDTLQQITANDFINANNVPIVVARYSDANQSIFKDFTASQSEFSITNESLVVVDDITKNNGLGQNLFDVYSVRSYTIKITCMGNATIQPFMYFYLEGVPMYQGLYLVIKVNHRIVPNSMETEITAIRMRNTMTKMVDIESLYHSLFAEASGTYNSGTQSSRIAFSSGGGAINGQGYSFSISSPFRNYINQEIFNSIGVTLGSGHKGEKFVLPEVRDFMYDVGKLWKEYAEGKEIPQTVLINHASLLNGGDTKLHASHEMGTSLDIRPIVNTKITSPTDINKANYSRQHTRELIKMIQTVSGYNKYQSLYADKKPVFKIYFNDGELINEFKPLVQKMEGHSNHLHVEIALPDKYKQYSINNGYKSEMDGEPNFVTGYNIGDKIDYLSPYGFTNSSNDYLQWCGSVSPLSHGMNDNKLRALLDVISYAEGTMGAGKANGYDVLFGSVGKKLKCINGYTLNTNIKHRGLKNGAANGNGNWATYHGSTPTGAAGRYQFMYNTWKEVHFSIDKEQNLTGKLTKTHENFNKPMTKLNQDNACAWLVLDRLNYSSPNSIVINNQNDLYRILIRLKSTWEAFQRINSNKRLSMDNLWNIYNKSLT